MGLMTDPQWVHGNGVTHCGSSFATGKSTSPAGLISAARASKSASEVLGGRWCIRCKLRRTCQARQTQQCASVFIAHDGSLVASRCFAARAL